VKRERSSVSFTRTPAVISLTDAFCHTCDSLGSDGICKLVPGTREAKGESQFRYAMEGSCDWATVEQIPGQMTNEGFKRSRYLGPSFKKR